jgi:uncharacterized protein YdeI (BOF family)
MFKRTFVIVLVVVVACMCARAQAQSETDGQAPAHQRQAASVKAVVQKMGVGQASEVRIKLRDGTQLRGHISQIENDSFRITDQGSNKVTSVTYADVQSMKGKGMSTRTKVLIGVGVGVGVLAVIVISLYLHHPFKVAI